MNPAARARLGLVLLGAACSTLAEIPDAEECTESSCAEGFVCHQGRCLSNDQAAPRAHLGFDIRERAAGQDRFRVEVDGCDCTVEESFRELAVRRSRVSQKLFLSAATPLEPPEDVLTARFELTQPSRFAEFPSPQIGSMDHPPMAEDTGLRWPRYHPLDEDVPPDLITWKLEPAGELALRYVALEPPRTDEDSPCTVDSDCCEPQGDCNPAPNFCDTTVGRCSAVGQPEWKYHHVYQPSCSRTIEGNAVPIDMETFTVLDEDPAKELSNATITMRYADSVRDGPFGVQVFGDVPPSQRPPECSDDGDCNAPVEFCDIDTQQCFLSLDGFSANRDTAAVTQGLFTTQVYTYCDLEGDDGLDRSYEVTVDPPGAHPTVDYLLDANFSPLNEPGTKFVAGQFCVPDWGEGVPLEIEFIGQPRPLITGDVEYTCCDIACLPATADDVEAPSSIPVTCDGRTDAGARPEVRVESYFVLDQDQIQHWLDADCVTPTPDPLGRVGSLLRTATCTTPDSPCLVEDVALGTPEAPRRYSVRIESEIGSVVASGDYTVELTDQPPIVQSLPLTPRVLVTGTVDVNTEVCGLRETDDCSAREAIVLAERIRMPDEPEGSVPGPYFHHVSTYYDPVTQRDGAFILPLDPGGVYVLTALPPAGAEGGPSHFEVVNLRDDADVELAPLRLVLNDGIVVTLRLDQFDDRTEVIPVDRGSFLADGQTLIHPARAGTADPFIDLNRIGECWTPPDEGARGCQIRRLIPPLSGLARSQVGVARFTARRSEGTECTNVCPQPDPTE